MAYVSETDPAAGTERGWRLTSIARTEQSKPLNGVAAVLCVDRLFSLNAQSFAEQRKHPRHMQMSICFMPKWQARMSNISQANNNM